MHRIVYILIFAVILLIFKAFFLDDYLKKQDLENNVTVSQEVQEPVSVEPVPAAPVPVKKVQPTSKNEGMPIDQLGDSIADKLDSKL
ncbi:hypothetical protein [Sulfuricurvum sp.]|uniref:hypothetical protein n=1 Tax=Sulfuricurvum sp. TaxID=2025608 RepID=UPI0026151BC0|nr:hypothetical protein [Sulfuricurvum sp.]MDD2780672.1 hypothetical protein [Sulfuricurvum sp.]